MTQRKNKSPRGVSLIEGMISMAVLLIGILGALQGTLVASRQNALADRMARAASMAAQARMGIEAQGRTRLRLGGGLFGGGCVLASSATAPLIAVSDGLNATALANSCIADIDAYDGGAAGGGTGGGAAAIDKTVPGYGFARDFPTFRRVAVYQPSPNGGADVVVVVVSIVDSGRRIFVKQVTGIYDSSPAGNGTLVDM